MAHCSDTGYVTREGGSVDADADVGSERGEGVVVVVEKMLVGMEWRAAMLSWNHAHWYSALAQARTRQLWMQLFSIPSAGIRSCKQERIG